MDWPLRTSTNTCIRQAGQNVLRGEHVAIKGRGGLGMPVLTTRLLLGSYYLVRPDEDASQQLSLWAL